MRRRYAATMIVATVMILWMWPVGAVQEQAPAGTKEAALMRASGAFDVKVTPQTSEKDEVTPLGRMSIEKQLHGDLEGTSRGEMLTALTPIKDSAGYVAVEKVSGTLHGRRGTFVLQHHGVMNRGAQQLTITVVPDSGTGQLAGLAGTMTISITDGKHFYELVYTLDGKP